MRGFQALLGLGAAVLGARAQEDFPEMLDSFMATVEAKLMDSNLSIIAERARSFLENATAETSLVGGEQEHTLDLDSLDLRFTFFGDRSSPSFPQRCVASRLSDNITLEVDIDPEYWLSRLEEETPDGENLAMYINASIIRGLPTRAYTVVNEIIGTVNATRESITDAVTDGIAKLVDAELLPPNPDIPEELIYFVNYTVTYHFAAAAWQVVGATDLPNRLLAIQFLANRDIYVPTPDVDFDAPDFDPEAVIANRTGEIQAKIETAYEYVYDYINFRAAMEPPSFPNASAFLPPAPTVNGNASFPFFDPAVYNYSSMCDVEDFCASVETTLAEADGNMTTVFLAAVRANATVCSDHELPSWGFNDTRFYNDGVVSAAAPAEESEDDETDESDASGGGGGSSGHSDGVLAGSIIGGIMGGVLLGTLAIAGYQRMRGAGDDAFFRMERGDGQL